MSKAIRGFYHYQEAWYASIIPHPNFMDEVMFGVYSPEGGTNGEIGMRWTELGGRNVPRLEIFDDAWKLLPEFTDVLSELASVNNKNISSQQFIEILIRCGFTDLTKRERQGE